MVLAELLDNGQLSAADIRAKTHNIREQLLKQSAHVRLGNFESIHPHDLQTLLWEYDQEFFRGAIRTTIGKTPLKFRLSRRLTSAAGQVTRRFVRAGGKKRNVEYEISVSSTILFQTFGEAARPIKASGLMCHDRLDALQRVFEHEVVHLAELLVWSDSHCTGRRFQSIARRFFGHREHTHQLVTPRERAWTKFGLKIGDRVTFQLDGKCYQGRLNRITRRATVLVENPRGLRYSNGRRYSKFYVPLAQLAPDSHGSLREPTL